VSLLFPFLYFIDISGQDGMLLMKVRLTASYQQSASPPQSVPGSILHPNNPSAAIHAKGHDLAPRIPTNI
jgi:hypothetical protein